MGEVEPIDIEPIDDKEVITETSPVDLVKQDPADKSLFAYVEKTSNKHGEIKVEAIAEAIPVSQTLPDVPKPAFMFFNKANDNFYLIPFPSEIDPSWQFIKVVR